MCTIPKRAHTLTYIRALTYMRSDLATETLGSWRSAMIPTAAVQERWSPLCRFKANCRVHGGKGTPKVVFIPPCSWSHVWTQRFGTHTLIAQFSFATSSCSSSIIFHYGEPK